MPDSFGLDNDSDRTGLAIWSSALNGEDKTITELGKGFDEAGFRCRVIQNAAELFDRGVQTVLEVYKGIRGPELLAELFACNDIARAVKQKG